MMDNKETPNVKRILLSQEDLKDRVATLGEQISRDYTGKEIVLVGVLKGSLYFLADLSRSITIPLMLDMISIGVYPGTTKQTGVVRITKDLDIDVSGKHVIVVEDIVRTGLTIGYLVQNLESKKAASVKVCSLFVNPNQQLINVPIAYTGFEIGNTWLVGYGMDISEKWRDLPYVAEMDRVSIKPD